MVEDRRWRLHPRCAAHTSSLRPYRPVPWYNAAMSRDLRLIDTHLHLQIAQYDGDRAAVIARAQAAGVARMLEVGYDLDSSRAAVELAEAHPSIFAVVGIQPHYAALADDTWLAEVRRLAAHPKAVAIGEIGL